MSTLTGSSVTISGNMIRIVGEDGFQVIHEITGDLELRIRRLDDQAYGQFIRAIAELGNQFRWVLVNITDVGQPAPGVVARFDPVKFKERFGDLERLAREALGLAV